MDRQELGADPALDEAIAQAMQVGREPNWLERLLTHWRLRRRVLDIPVPMHLSQWRLQRTVAGLPEQINREPKDAQVTIKPDDTLDKLPGQSGLALQVADSVVGRLTRFQALHQSTYVCASLKSLTSIAACSFGLGKHV